MPAGAARRICRQSLLMMCALILSALPPFDRAPYARGDDGGTKSQPPSGKDDRSTSRPSKRSADRPPSWKGDNTAGLPWRPGQKPVRLWPPPEGEAPERRQVGSRLVLGEWSYRSERSANALDGVPWVLYVEPADRESNIWRRGDFNQAKPEFLVGSSRAAQDPAEVKLPVIELPEVVWRERMANDLQDVVGIHFHEFVSNDVARILYTIHKVPPDNPDGSPMNGVFDGKSGTRIEATLLTPVIWSLDQSVVVRVDNQRTPDKAERDRQTAYRIEHETGHAAVSQQVLLEVIAGPQTWNPKYCEGRRSRVEYFWKRELIGKSWDGYQRNVGKLATLRTTVALVPPTRWSLLLPIPPERVTQRHLEQFNEQIVLLGPQFINADKAAQEKFHSHHGEFDATGGP